MISDTPSAQMVERLETEEARKLEALRCAAQIGWDDLSAGRFSDICENQLNDLIGELGARAVEDARARR